MFTMPMTPKMRDSPRAIKATINPQISPFIKRKVMEDKDSTDSQPASYLSRQYAVSSRQRSSGKGLSG
jgi:hypothetical protein